MADKSISQLPAVTAIQLADLLALVDGGVTYSGTFTQLLALIAANISTGANLSFGTAIPANTAGVNGDVFIKTTTGQFAQKISGTWTVVYAIPTATGTSLTYGSGTPNPANGNDGDSYVNTTGAIFYEKISGTWTQQFSLATGPQGPQGTAGTNGTNGTSGNAVLNGTTNPINTLGRDGDFYLNTVSYYLFGPKASGVWPAGVSLIPTAGARMIVDQTDARIALAGNVMTFTPDSAFIAQFGTTEPTMQVLLPTTGTNKASSVASVNYSYSAPGVVATIFITDFFNTVFNLKFTP